MRIRVSIRPQHKREQKLCPDCWDQNRQEREREKESKKEKRTNKSEKFSHKIGFSQTEIYFFILLYLISEYCIWIIRFGPFTSNEHHYALIWRTDFVWFKLCVCVCAAYFFVLFSFALLILEVAVTVLEVGASFSFVLLG